jgi:hypothetical protein
MGSAAGSAVWLVLAAALDAVLAAAVLEDAAALVLELVLVLPPQAVKDNSIAEASKAESNFFMLSSTKIFYLYTHRILGQAR